MTYYKAIIITTLWFGIKIGKYINAIDWHYTQNKPTIYTNESYCHLAFGEGVKQPSGERKVFSTNGARTTGYPHGKKLTSTPTSHHTQKLIWDGSET